MMPVAKKVMTLNRRQNVITKERLDGGAWKYTVASGEGAVLLEVVFEPGANENKLHNNDLLDIVRDRLDALNRTGHGTFRSYNCAQHVYEALFWADAPALKSDDEEREDIDNG